MDIPGLDALMNAYAIILLALGMSMDAFAASMGKGATLHKPKFSEAIRTGLIFGVIETLTPLIGWGLGMLASRFVLEWSHWVAFVLLVFLGGTTEFFPKQLWWKDSALVPAFEKGITWCAPYIPDSLMELRK